MVLIVVGFAEFGRLVWTSEVLQEAVTEGARCMGLRASSCAAGGIYSAANTTAYARKPGAYRRRGHHTCDRLAEPRGVLRRGHRLFSGLEINYNFLDRRAGSYRSTGQRFTVSASACFPNSSEPARRVPPVTQDWLSGSAHCRAFRQVRAPAAGPTIQPGHEATACIPPFAAQANCCRSR